MSEELKSMIEMKNEISMLQQQTSELKQELECFKKTEFDQKHGFLFSMFQNAPYGVIVIDAEKSLFVNPEGTAITGYSLADVPTVNACFENLFPNAEYQEYVKKKWLSDIKKNGNRQKREFYVRCKNSEIKSLEFHIYVMDLSTIFVIFNDVTSINKDHPALVASEYHYRMLFEENGTAMVLLENDRTILLVNKKFAELSGFSRAELEGKRAWTDFIVPEDRSLLIKQIENGLTKSGEGFPETEFRFIDRNKNIKHISTRISKISETNRLLITLWDISSHKHAEQEHELRIKKLQKDFTEIKTLQGILPICAFCKKVRDENGEWKQVEVYIEENSQLEFTHSICPDCGKKLYSTYQIEEDSL